MLNSLEAFLRDLSLKHIFPFLGGPTDLSSKATGTPKKKAVVQAKLTATGQVTSPVKGASLVTNSNPRKFSGFSGERLEIL